MKIKEKPESRKIIAISPPTKTSSSGEEDEVNEERTDRKGNSWKKNRNNEEITLYKDDTRPTPNHSTLLPDTNTFHVAHKDKHMHTEAPQLPRLCPVRKMILPYNEQNEKKLYEIDS